MSDDKPLTLAEISAALAEALQRDIDELAGKAQG